MADQITDTDILEWIADHLVHYEVSDNVATIQWIDYGDEDNEQKVTVGDQKENYVEALRSAVINAMYED